jgi:hypothetical protein
LHVQLLLNIQSGPGLEIHSMKSQTNQGECVGPRPVRAAEKIRPVWHGCGAVPRARKVASHLREPQNSSERTQLRNAPENLSHSQTTHRNLLVCLPSPRASCWALTYVARQIAHMRAHEAGESILASSKKRRSQLFSAKSKDAVRT